MFKNQKGDICPILDPKAPDICIQAQNSQLKSTSSLIGPFHKGDFLAFYGHKRCLLACTHLSRAPTFSVVCCRATTLPYYQFMGIIFGLSTTPCVYNKVLAPILFSGYPHCGGTVRKCFVGHRIYISRQCRGSGGSRTFRNRC